MKLAMILLPFSAFVGMGLILNEVFELLAERLVGRRFPGVVSGVRA